MQEAALAVLRELDKFRNRARRDVMGWIAYDWANSGFTTTVITVLAGPYLTALAQSDVGRNGVVAALGPFGSITALSFFPFCISASVVLEVLLLPPLGAIADYSGTRKTLMAAFCYAGVAATCLMFFVTGHRYLLGGLLLVLANFASGVTIVLYNAFLNDIATERERDRISTEGYAAGYLGGGLLLAANLALVGAAHRIGVSTELAVRISLLSAGVWWGAFASITFACLPERPPAHPNGPRRSYVAIGFSELRALCRQLRRLPHTSRFLVAYTTFNDAILTVIAVASVFLAQELFVARGLPTDETFLMGLILVVQFVACAGALLFNRVADAVTTKTAILLSLVVWIGIVLYAYGALHTVTQAWIMGVVLATVLGGSQALSRSLFSRMIPEGHEAAFFGLYELTESTSWVGPFLFGFVASVTGSYREAILSLVVLFIAGFVMLLLTDTRRAIDDAAHRGW